MARNFYRFYLYTVFIALLVFAVIATTQLLNTLFDFTPLYTERPTQATLIQAVVFALVSWVISGGLGGLHYWLIRRDIQSDPAAGVSAIRSLFLNATEALGVMITVSVVGLTLSSWAYGGSSVVQGISQALPTLAMVGFLEWERRRSIPRGTLALVFQRLHFFGVQFYLLMAVLFGFLSNLPLLINGLFINHDPISSYCSVDSYCPTYNYLAPALSILWYTLAWLVYCLATRTDTSRNTRMIIHSLSLALGSGFILSGVFILLKLLLQPLYNVPVTFIDNYGINRGYDFITPLVTGLVIAVVYHLLLRDIAKRRLITPQMLRLSEWTIAAILLAGVFWGGCYYGLDNLLQVIGHTPNGPDNQAWIATIALLVTGLGYIPLDLYLRRRYALDPDNTVGPRRGFVLALLAVGTLAVAIGGAIGLYAWGTALLGSPIDNWTSTAQGGFSSFLIGAVIVAIYLWTTRHEHLVTRRKQVDQPPTIPVIPETATTIESVLDQLLANQITREQAAAHIRELNSLPKVVPVVAE